MSATMDARYDAPGTMRAPDHDYARIERAIAYLRDHAREQPSLEAVARHVGLSAFHFQRLFQRWAGVSPKRFLQFVTLEDAKPLLLESRSLLDTSLEVGLSGPSRLHDLFVKLERMTPGEFKERAKGLVIRWDVAPTPLGPALFAALEGEARVTRGLCGLSFVSGGAGEALEELREKWPAATLRRDAAAIAPYAETLAARFRGETHRPLSLVLKGTPLQLKTWEALLRIPAGRVAAYSDVAALAGAPRATRAVASAIGANPLAILIPCHRVIRSTGVIGEYHWGRTRKVALLAAEQARLGP